MLRKYCVFVFYSISILSCRTRQHGDLNGGALAENNSTYQDKFNTLISLTERNPQEEQFVRGYSSLTENVVSSADTLLTHFLKESKGQSSFEYISKEKNIKQFYVDLVKMHSLGNAKIQDLARRQQIDSIFSKATISKGASDWIDQLFKEKSMIETIAEFRQIQTDCLVARDLVFDDMIDRLNKK